MKNVITNKYSNQHCKTVLREFPKSGLNASETSELMSQISDKFDLLIKKGDLSIESINTIMEMASQFKDVHDHLNKWWTIENSNEV